MWALGAVLLHSTSVQILPSYKFYPRTNSTLYISFSFLFILGKLRFLHSTTHALARSWSKELSENQLASIRQHFGEFPKEEALFHTLVDGPSWLWWITAILPLDSRAQLAILRMTSLENRITAISKVLNFFRPNHG